MSISKYNKTGSPFTAVPNNVSEFDNLSTREAYEKYHNTTVQILGVFVSNNGYHYPQAITPFEFVRLPIHLRDSVNEILKDTETINQINCGEAGVKFTTWNDSEGVIHYSAEFVDM